VKREVNISDPMQSHPSIISVAQTSEKSGNMDFAPRADVFSIKNVEVPLKGSSTEPIEKTHTIKQEMTIQPEISKSSKPKTKKIQNESPLPKKAVDDVVVAPTSGRKEADVAAGFSAVAKGETQKAPAVPVGKPQTAKNGVSDGLSKEKKAEVQKDPDALTVEPETAKNVTKKVSKGKKVRFSVLQIRDYPIIVGGNPAVSKGVPVTIDWTHDGEVIASIDDYEHSRGTPRSMLELRIPPRVRTENMKRLGFSNADVLAGTKAANIVRCQRRRTIETLQTAAMEEFLEKWRRAILNATIMRGRKRREREYLYIYKPVINVSKEKTSVDTYVGDSSFLISFDKLE
jgi:hypothetical protein